jgi:hypothetical protein
VGEFFQALRALESLNKTGLRLSKKEAIFFNKSFAVKKFTASIWAIWCHEVGEMQNRGSGRKV